MADNIEIDDIVIEVPSINIYINEVNLDPATSIGQKYVFEKLSFTGNIDGTNKIFTITEAYVGNVQVKYQGSDLAKDDPTGYTKTGNDIETFMAPLPGDVIEIWGNKQST
jgi:hypothetical protein